MPNLLSLCSQRGFIGNLTRSVVWLNDNKSDASLLNETELALRVGQLFKIVHSNKNDLDALAHLVSLTTLKRSRDDEQTIILRAKTCVTLFQLDNEGNSPKAETIKLLQECARSEDMFAMCAYAEWLAQLDKKRAFQFYKTAAEKGDVKGLLGLAKCFAKGRGTEKDKTRL